MLDVYVYNDFFSDSTVGTRHMFNVDFKVTCIYIHEMMIELGIYLFNVLLLVH